jgi:hypothetical protein
MLLPETSGSGMHRRRFCRSLKCTLRCALIYLSVLACVCAQADSGKVMAELRATDGQRDGQHDFDFSFGIWKTHISRRLHPLTGSDVWADYEGTSVVSKIWNGRGGLGQTEADGPAGHLQALSLRLYNPQAHQWSLTYASTGGTTSTPTSLSVPTIGEFKQGRGEFFDTELFNGRSILVRNVWSDITSNSCRFEQAFSEDGGATWEINWKAIDTRMEAGTGAANAGPQEDIAEHDFDFEFGTWKTHLSRLLHPLTGSKTWVDYDGTTAVRKVWSGRSNLVELDADGLQGHFEGLNLRLYNPQSHQWSLNFASSRDGTFGPPTIGEFKNGRGEFYDQEVFNGRAIFVRFVITDITPSSCRFEQAFSTDGGRTWEVNWIATDTRVNDESHKTD